MLTLRLFAAVTALSAAVALVGCSTTVEQRGNLPPPDEIAEIHPGKTTKDQVAKILGTPSSIGVFNDNSWYYISRRTTQFAFFDPDVVDQQVYVVDFNDHDIVKAVDHKTLKDGREINPVARATPAPGRELSFLEQIVGNLGKFNNAGAETGGGGGGRGPGPNPQSEE
jgi:outer membrane protein assembly factor BamE (lipoprotein component of BamABCDE complex)